MNDVGPFLISGTSAALPITAGVGSRAISVLPSEYLTNTTRQPVEIRELNFLLVSTRTGGNPGTMLSAYAALEVQINVGREGITNGFTPPLCFRSRPGIPTQEDFTVGALLDGIIAGTQRWILPKPLVLMPQESLSVSVRISPTYPFFVTQTGTLKLSVVARGIVSPGAVRKFIPYVSGRLYSAAGSVPQDLTFYNVFRSPLTISSLYFYEPEVDAPANQPFVIVGPGGLANVVRRVVVDGQVGSAFVGDYGAVEVSHTLNPNESYQITIDPGTSFAAGAGRGPLFVGINGYREA